MTSAIRPANRLALETSPYLLQHAHNPVDWYPWGSEALELAAREDRPILLSVGYSACHWCHVMERECFEDESIAALMNKHFVCIKVDREERPDIDDVYMAATLAINGNGGWPMTVFCTPEQSPFFAGTYFPPDDRQGRPGFPSLLLRIAELWQNDRDALFRQAGELTDHLRSQTALSPPKTVSETATAQALLQLKRSFDSQHGGFGDAPKFPPSQALHLLFRKHQSSGEPELLEMATATLDGMKNGGIYDQLGGGFARYSVDAEWLVPHFEKMLYDNAQLARVYTEAFQVTKNPEYRRVACETLDYVIREMQAPEGGYYSATDADSEGVEGKFFVFTPKQLRSVLEPEETRVFCAYYDVTEEGNWEGTNVLHAPRAAKEVALELKIDPDDFSNLLTRARAKVFAERSHRVAPTTDDKVLTAWNSLMIGSMAEAARVFGEERYLTSARRAAQFVLEHLVTGDRQLLRTARAGKAHLAAVLEDYAYLCDALIDLYECGGEAAYLTRAENFAQTLIRDFYDAESGTFFATGVDHEPLIVRRRDGNDGALPSASAVAARALLRLSRHFDNASYRTYAESLVRAYGERIERAPRSHLTLLNLVDDLLEAPVEIVYAAADFAASGALRAQVAECYLPRRVIAHSYGTESAAASHGLLAGKAAIGGEPTLFVCKDYQCEAPTTRPKEVSARLLTISNLTRTTRRRELRPATVTGYATAAGTERYFARQRLHPSATRRLNGCWVSRVGFGTHRVHEMNTSHQRALLLALREGCNLVETAPSYGAGASERTVGNSITELIRAQVVARDELVIITKLGVIEGEDARLLAALAEPPAQCLSLDRTTQYCLAPTWLEAQLQASLARLNVDTLDVCLLHNPELLADHGVPVIPQLVAAFRFLEGAVANGTVRAYGVSSNVLHLADSPLSLDVVLEAKRLAEATHCNVVSLPYNAHEREARTQGVLSKAAAAGLSVLTQRPLDAFRGGVRQRLVSSPAVTSVLSLHEAKQEVAKLEHEFRAQLGAVLRAVPGADLKTDSFFLWSERIVPAVLTDRETWNEFERQHLAYELPRMLSAMEQAMRGKQIGQLWRSWRERYTHHMEQLVVAARHETKERSDLQNLATLTELRGAAPEAQQLATLSQLAVWFASSPLGVTATLLGMRDPDYVRDALATLRWPDWSELDEENQR